VDADLAALPNDIDALRAALTIERAKMRDVVVERDAGAAELAVARARASGDLALIAHQKLRIAKLGAPDLRSALTALGPAHRSTGAAVRGAGSERHRS
jgi:hypothetical protein